MSFSPKQLNGRPEIVIKKSPKVLKKPTKLKVIDQLEQSHQPQKKINTKMNPIDEVLLELDMLVGLQAIKKLVLEIHAYVQIQKKRESELLKTEPVVLHMIFKGNPLKSQGKSY